MIIICVTYYYDNFEPSNRIEMCTSRRMTRLEIFESDRQLDSIRL